MEKIALILVAAGKGARAGGEIPKQYQIIAGKPLLRHTIDTFATHRAAPDFQTVIVYSKPDKAYLEDLLAELGSSQDETIRRVEGGATRTASVKAGMAALAGLNPPDIVLIHDAARPFVSHSVISDLIAALKTHLAAVPTLPIPDAIKSMNIKGHLGDDIDRDTLRRVQTPQAFRFADIWPAFQALAPEDSFSDDIAIANQAGMSIAAVTGDERNFKLTYPEDFEKANAMLSDSTYIATGTGYDVHRYTDGSSIWLCGIEIPASYTLLGHSDADAGLHALTDAIFGALADGDIGDHFPPSDPQWKGASSDKFLRFAVEKVQARGGRIEHVDVTLICEKPKVKPHREAMRARIAELLGLSVNRVSVKATTTEKLGFTGREEGLAAMASATLRLPE